MKIAVVNGPNLNMCGKRDVNIYGAMTLPELNDAVESYAAEKNIETIFFQSNSEGALIDYLQCVFADAVIFNAGAYTHYSYALKDCIECIGIPVAEVHLSNVFLREPYRAFSVFDGLAVAKFYGKKEKSYFEAVDFFEKYLLKNEKKN